jgi:hypothetical protein
VAAIHKLCADTVLARIHATGEQTPSEPWPSRRGLLGTVPLLRGLGECWASNGPGYRLIPPVPPPQWWSFR